MRKDLEYEIIHGNDFDCRLYIDGDLHTKIWETFSDRLKQIILLYLSRFSGINVLCFDVGDSPIEQILYASLDIYMKMKNKEKIWLLPQIEVKANNHKYIADFIYFEDEYINSEMKTGRKVIIECDGYEFHQKTKEQVQHDNEREYDLKMAGYEIIRFSGSQIYNQPMKCAEDLYNFITRKQEE